MYLPQDAWFYSHVLLLATVQPHCLSQQILSSCWLPHLRGISLDSYRLCARGTITTWISHGYCLIITIAFTISWWIAFTISWWIAFTISWWKRIGVNATSALCKQIQKPPYSYKVSSCKRHQRQPSLLCSGFVTKQRLNSWVERIAESDRLPPSLLYSMRQKL